MKKDILSTLTLQQQSAFNAMKSGENVFLTGGAGSGKSYLVRSFQQEISAKDFPVLASTGAAAVLVGGRTFHSFFGLGIFEGGVETTIKKASEDSKVVKRIRQVEGVIIDEISMIPGQAFQAAETISRVARKSRLPWGGLRIIAVGDFFQLPPVSRGVARDWCFKTETWNDSGFLGICLQGNQRVEEDQFLNILNSVRNGQLNEGVTKFLNSRVNENNPHDKSIRLFPRRDQSEQFNLHELSLIEEKEIRFDTIYIGEPRRIEIIKKICPIPEQICLKLGSSVMFLQNDSQKRWINGTRGKITEIGKDFLRIQKVSGREVTVERAVFTSLDAEGEIVASAINFPICLAYATTIHKSQGATLDRLWVDLSRLWEPGHAYVALSRLTSGEGLNLLRWNTKSFIIDPNVIQFYDQMKSKFEI